MSKPPSKSVLRELNLLAALDSVQARVDTSAIAEIQDWSAAVIGKFYGADVEQPLPDANHPSESSAVADRPMIVSVPDFTHQVTPQGAGYAQVTASQLISICLSTHDEAAWSEFLRRYQPLIAGVISRYVRRLGAISHELVEELVQEVYVKLCANNFQVVKRFEFSHENALVSFMKVVANHVAQDYLRSAMAPQKAVELNAESKSRNSSHSQLNELPFTEARDSSAVRDRELLIQEIEKLLQTHSGDPNFVRDNRIFWLYYRNGLSAEVISRLPELGLTKKGVESVLFRMTREIKQHLSPLASEKKNKKNPEK